MSFSIVLRIKRIKSIFMQFETGHWYHVYNRGNNRQKIFFEGENYLYFLRKVRKHIIPHANIIAYCLMPNHFHFLLKVKSTKREITKTETHPLKRKIAVVLSSYAQAINNQEGRSGSLFQTRTKAKNLSDGGRNYARTCFHYIHQNPLKAGLVKRLEDWPFSSYRDYAGFRKGSLPTKEMAFEAFAIKDANHFIECSHHVLSAKLVKKIF